ncbi:unnamed protein product, partial [Staurois parvus]
MEAWSVNKPRSVRSSRRFGSGRSEVENKPRVITSGSKIWIITEKTKSKILAAEHNNLANRKCRDLYQEVHGRSRGFKVHDKQSQ